MIRKIADLEAHLNRGGTVALSRNLTEAGWRLVDPETDQTVYRSTLDKVVERGGALGPNQSMITDGFKPMGEVWRRRSFRDALRSVPNNCGQGGSRALG